MHTFKTMLPIEMIKLLFSFHPDIVLEEGTLNYDKKTKKNSKLRKYCKPLGDRVNYKTN